MAILLLAPIDAALAAEKWFCAAELSTGFKLSQKTWRVANFAVDGNRYTVNKSADGKFTVSQLGYGYPRHSSCENTSDAGEPAWIVCGGLGMGFVFREDTLRFQENYGIGFLDGRDEEGNTPSLTIGRCSPID